MRIRSALALHKSRRLASSGRVAEAVELLKKTYALSTDPRLLIQAVRLAGSREDRELLISRHPDDGSAMLIATISALDARDNAGALLAATRGLSARPDDPSLRASLVIARSRVDAEPMDWTALHESAKNATLGVKVITLIEVEREIMRLFPTDRGAREKDDTLGGPAGFILDRLDDLAAIMRWMLSSLLNLVLNATDSRKRAVYRHIIEGDRLSGQRRKDEAAKQFEETLRLDPECAEALESLARYYLETGDVGKATARFMALDKALSSAVEPVHAHLSRLRADIAFFNGEFQKALSLYAEAVKTSPHDYMAHYRMGLCHLRMNDDKGAVGPFRRVLSIPNAGLLEERFEVLLKELRPATANERRRHEG